MLESLFEAIGKEDISRYSSVLFNIYEDKDAYTIEACFDDDALVIGRDKPFVICGKDISWDKAEKKAGKELTGYIKSSREKYKGFSSIAYGFVEGDLNYIRSSDKKTEKVLFSAEDFKDLPPAKLKAWMTVYLTDEATKQSWKEWFKVRFEDLPEDKLDYWRAFLADNFNYEKYDQNR